MANVFNLRNLNLRNLGIVARVAAKHAGRSRSLSSLGKACRATAAHFGRVLHQLWLEVTGFVFLSLAGIGAIAFLREYAKFAVGRTSSGRVLLAVGFTAMFGWFGLSSFWRIWRKRS
jgi:hypothetical protein